AGYRQVKVLEFFDCSGPRQGVEDLREVELQGAQGDRKAIRFKKPIDMLGFFGWHASIKQWILEPVKFKCISLGYHKSIVANKLWRLDDVTLKENVDKGAGLQEVQTQDLIDYQLARDNKQHLACELFRYREDNNEDAFEVAAVEKMYAHESLTFNNIVVSTVAENAVTTAMAIIGSIHQAEIWATKSLLVKAKGNILNLEIFRDQSGNTLRVSQSRIHNEKLVQTFLKGHSTLLLEDSLSMDCDVKKMKNVQVCVDFDYAIGISITLMSRSITGYGLMILGCVGSLKSNLQHMKALLTTKAGYVMFTEAWKKETWLKGLLTKSRHELSLVAGIATRALAEIWATKSLLVKAKGNILNLEIIRDQSGNTLRVSQSKIHNEKL
nr:zinc finger, CCHC-type [Tanacetum cinerariifolium]